MKVGSTLFLKAVISLIGVAIFALCVFLLNLAFSDSTVGGYTPILLGMCVTALPFFLALFQAMKLLNYIDTNKAFSELSVKALKNIKYCAATISALYAAGMPYIFYVAELDDAPGVILIGMIFTFAPLVVAVFAAVLQKLLQSGLDIQSENDLTV